MNDPAPPSKFWLAQIFEHTLKAAVGVSILIAVLVAAILIVRAVDPDLYGELRTWLRTAIGPAMTAKGTGVQGANPQGRVGAALVSASGQWQYSGFDLEPGQLVQVRSSGYAHLALDKLVENAHRNGIPDIPWSQPNGYPWRLRSQPAEGKDRIRVSSLLLPTACTAALVGILVPTREIDPTYSAFDRNAVVLLGEHAYVRNSSDRRQRLFLAVNDIALDGDEPRRKLVYLGHDEPYSEEEEESWRQVSERQHWRVFADDNVGYYQVSIQEVAEQAETVPGPCEQTKP